MGKERHEKKESGLDKKEIPKLTSQAVNAVVGLSIAGAAANILSGVGK